MNMAVSSFHYGVPGLRLLLAHAIEELTEPLDQDEFWKAYATADANGLTAILGRLSVRLSALPVQPRLREVLSARKNSVTKVIASGRPRNRCQGRIQLHPKT